MKPGRAEIPEMGIPKESQAVTPEAMRQERVEQAIGHFEKFVRTFQPIINPADFKKDLDYRTRATELFANKSKEEIGNAATRQQTEAADIRLLFGVHTLVTQDLINENMVAGRSHLTHEQNLARLRETIEFQQNLTRFIVQNRTMRNLDAIMLRYWNTFQDISFKLTQDPDAAKNNEHGIEHAVTGSQILEERGWRTHKPRTADDMKKGTDGIATGVTLDGKEVLLALQFKPNRDSSIIGAEVLYPYPSQAAIDEDAWDLVANVKEHRVKNPQIPLFPVLMRVPSSYQTRHIRRGTGLLASPQSADMLLDEKSKKALEYAETLADVKTTTTTKSKKRIIVYGPQAK